MKARLILFVGFGPPPHHLQKEPRCALSLRALNVAGDADVDGDGVPDVAIGAFRDAKVRVFSGQTGATLVDVAGAANSRFGWTIDLADLNGDGHADLAVGRRTSAKTDAVSVVSGLTGKIAFDTALAPDLTDAAFAGDVDGDGVVDLLIATDAAASNGLFGVARGGPWLGAAAASDVAGGGDLLTVNGSSGGPGRRVDVGAGDSLQIGLAGPSTSPPNVFVVFGMLGAPNEIDAHAFAGLNGTLALFPAPLAPAAYPLLFTLTSTHPVPGGALIPAAPGAPWLFELPAGIPFPLTFALEAVVEDGVAFSATNAVLVNVE